VSTGAVEVLTMVPKDESVRSMLASIEVRLPPDFSAIREVRMHEPGGDWTRIWFHRELRGVTIPVAAFDQRTRMDMAVIKSILSP
jgi:hypothetical protein